MDRFQLDNKTYSELEKLAINPCESFLNGGVTTSFMSVVSLAGEAVAPISAASDVIGDSSALVNDLVNQLVSTVTSYAASELGSRLGSLCSPPSIYDITANASQLSLSYIKSVKEILSELSQEAESFDDDLSLSQLTDKINTTTSLINDKVGVLKTKINAITDSVSSYSKAICSYIYQGPEFVETQMNKYQDIFISEISKLIDTNIGFLEDQKQKVIDSATNGLANAVAAALNEENRETIFNQLTEAKQAIAKATIVAKAAVGKALLNTMAKLGL